MSKYTLLISLFFMANNYGRSQSKFNISFECGTTKIIPIFYKGFNASSNDENIVESKLGLISSIHTKWYYTKNSFLCLGAVYESTSINITNYFKFPNDLFAPNKSYEYSNFNVHHLGLRLSFGNSLGEKIKINTGFQLGFPLNDHFGYLYFASTDKIERNYDYETKKSFSIFTNLEYRWYKTKRIEFTLVPEFSYNLQKDFKTYIHENQIRKMNFALRVGVALLK